VLLKRGEDLVIDEEKLGIGRFLGVLPNTRIRSIRDLVIGTKRWVERRERLPVRGLYL